VWLILTSASPFIGMYDAIFRFASDGSVFRPEERLTFDEALRIYTRGGAFAGGWVLLRALLNANRMEHCLGRIEEGFLADLVLTVRSVF
jgi:predicted amidohydrolase YtcJ